MTGLPRVPSTLRRRLVWEHMLLGGLERLTDALRRGDEFLETDLHDMRALDMRLHAFSDALAARVAMMKPEDE
jgi:hypothetical protein